MDRGYGSAPARAPGQRWLSEMCSHGTTQANTHTAPSILSSRLHTDAEVGRDIVEMVQSAVQNRRGRRTEPAGSSRLCFWCTFRGDA
jgi:hypothetical protein